MNYQRIYNEIINNAKLRGLNKKKLDYYTEKHHIVPKCLGGTNDKSNLVLLTAKEHFVCHHLLYKSDNKKLVAAFVCMNNVKNDKHKRYKSLLTANEYSLLRIEYSKAVSIRFKGRVLSIETKEKLSKAHKGKILSEEHKRKLSESHIGIQACLGHKASEETKLKLSNSHIGYKASEETKLKMSKALKGRIFTKEWKEKISKAKIGKDKGKVLSISQKENIRNGMLKHFEKIKALKA